MVGHRPAWPLLFLQIPIVLYRTVPCRAELYRASPKCSWCVKRQRTVQGWSKNAQVRPVGRGHTVERGPKEKERKERP